MISVDEKSSVLLKMQELERRGEWEDLAELTESSLAEDPEWFDASTYLQAATIELAAAKYPTDSEVQRAVKANRLVRRLADELMQEQAS